MQARMYKCVQWFTVYIIYRVYFIFPFLIVQRAVARHFVVAGVDLQGVSGREAICWREVIEYMTFKGHKR